MKKAKKLTFKYDKLKAKCILKIFPTFKYKSLKIGETYTIKEIELENYFTYFHFEEIPNERFTSTLFDINIEEDKEILCIEVEDEDGNIEWYDIDISKGKEGK